VTRSDEPRIKRTRGVQDTIRDETGEPAIKRWYRPTSIWRALFLLIIADRAPRPRVHGEIAPRTLRHYWERVVHLIWIASALNGAFLFRHNGRPFSHGLDRPGWYEAVFFYIGPVVLFGLAAVVMMRLPRFDDGTSETLDFAPTSERWNHSEHVDSLRVLSPLSGRIIWSTKPMSNAEPALKIMYIAVGAALLLSIVVAFLV